MVVPPPSPDAASVLAALLQVARATTQPGLPEEALAGAAEAAGVGLGLTEVAAYRRHAGGDRLEGMAGWRLGSAWAADVIDLAAGGPEATAALTGTEVPLEPGGVVLPLGAGGALRARWSIREPHGGVAALRLVAHHLGATLAVHALTRAQEARAREFRALQRLSRQMTATQDPSRLLALVVEEALELTGAEGGGLYLVEGEWLRREAWAGEPPPPGRGSLPMGYGIPGWVARSGVALRVSDRGRHREDAAVVRHSQLAVPLVSEGRTLGVLALGGRGAESFSASHEELLSVFASQAAKAIEAARLLDQVRRERDLRDRILGGTPNGVVALDGGRRVTLMNLAARRLLGVAEEPEGNSVGRYLPGAAFLEAVDRVLGGASALESLELLPGPGDRGRHLLATVFPLEAAAPWGATVILQDETERKRLDEGVQRMARLASIGQLAAGIAHEIRNPLTGVGISLDILGEESLSPGGRSLLGDINREIDRLEQLIRGLLAFARPQPVEPRPMRIAKALEWHRTFREQCRKKQVRFRLELRGNPSLAGDPEKLKQLFLNLALNALDATPEGGEIRIWADRVMLRGQPWVRVAVEDTGQGMDPDTQARVFDPFFTTKNEGTGLGLSIAHSVADQHGGTIDVQSAPGRGARFLVDLPALAEGPKEE